LVGPQKPRVGFRSSWVVTASGLGIYARRKERWLGAWREDSEGAASDRSTVPSWSIGGLVVTNAPGDQLTLSRLDEGSRRMLPIGSPTASQMAPRQPDLEHPMVTRGELLTAGRGTGGRSAGYTSTVSEETVESAEWRAVGAQTTVGGRARRRPRAERWLGLAPQLCVGIGGQYGSGGGASERPARTEWRLAGVLQGDQRARRAAGRVEEAGELHGRQRPRPPQRRKQDNASGGGGVVVSRWWGCGQHTRVERHGLLSVIASPRRC
jgi:hypothetical protein